MAKRVLSDDDITIAIHLREDKRWTIDQIAQKFGVSTSCIGYHFLKFGVEISRHIPMPRAVPLEETVYHRNGRAVRRFTAAEDAEILRRDRDGEPMYKIGEKIGRQAHVIRARLQTLARREERLEQLGRRPQQQTFFSKIATA